MNTSAASTPKRSLSWRNLTLRTKLIISLLFASLIPLTIISVISDNTQNKTLTNDADARLENAALLVADKIDGFISYNLNTVRAESQAPAIVEYASLPASERPGSLEEARVYTLLQSLAKQSPVYMNTVAILDPKGITLADTDPSAVGRDRSERYYYQQVLATNLPYASTMEYDAITKRPSLYFAAPIRDREGKLIGILRKRFDAAILQDFVFTETGLAGEGSFGVLLDENLVRIAHGANRDIIYKSVVPFDTATLTRLQEQRFMPPGTPEELSTNLPDLYTGLKNYEKIPHFAAEFQAGGGELEQAAVVKLKTQNWLVVFAQSQTIYTQPLNQARQNNITTGLLVALGIVLFGVLLSQTLAGPIVRLTQTAETIAGGDINILAKVETGDEIGALANTFNRMTQQLRDFIQNLEQRVAARTKDLATVAEVGTATATILETNRLLQTVVDLTKERFGLYHSHIYLLDENSENLVLTAGAGEPGRIMSAEKRSIPLSREQSLVARAARERKGVIVNDVTQDPNFLANPLLPNTRAELAVPMIVGETLVGVFDIQSEEVGRFGESDASIQTTLAAQIATSIQNARSYERSKEQADFEALLNAIGQKIQRATTVEDTLQTAVREIGTALGAQRVQVKLQTNRQDVNTSSQN